MYQLRSWSVECAGQGSTRMWVSLEPSVEDNTELGSGLGWEGLNETYVWLCPSPASHSMDLARHCWLISKQKVAASSSPSVTVHWDFLQRAASRSSPLSGMSATCHPFQFRNTKLKCLPTLPCLEYEPFFCPEYPCCMSYPPQNSLNNYFSSQMNCLWFQSTYVL